jgi:uncharacterized protein
VLLDGKKVLAGDKEHKLVVYPGVAHTMNIAPKFNPVLGEPDQQVITEIQGWLDSHR